VSFKRAGGQWGGLRENECLSVPIYYIYLASHSVSPLTCASLVCRISVD